MKKSSSRSGLASELVVSQREPREPLRISVPQAQPNPAGLFSPADRLRQEELGRPASPSSGSPASPPRSPCVPEAFARAAVTEVLVAANMPTHYRKPKLLTGKQGVIVTQNGLVTPTYEPAAQEKTGFVLYSFVTYNETDKAAATFAAPVYEGFDSRHPFYTQIFGLDKHKITNGGEIIFKVKTDGSMEVAFWTDKTGTFFETMFLNHLKIHNVDTSELEKIESRSARALAAKAQAIAEIPNYYAILTADKFISAKAWEDALCNHEGNGLLIDSSGTKGAAALFEQRKGIYQLKEQISGLDLSRLPEAALNFVTALAYEIDEELAATTWFRSFCM